MRVVVVGLDEQSAAEQRMPGVFGGDLYGQVMFRVRADVEVRNEPFAVLHMNLHAVPEGVENLRRDGLIDRSPINGLGR